MSFCVELVSGLTAFILVFVFYIKLCHTYWSRRNVPYIKTTSIFGNIENPLRVKDGLLFRIKACYDEFRKHNEIHGGLYFFTEAIYVPINIDLIKNILTKDFPHFLGHGFYVNERVDPLAAHLFNLEGEKWRNMRIKLSPTFTSGKMRNMFRTILDCGTPLVDHIENLCQNNQDLDIKEILACYTTDIIGSCAFGLECNSFKDPNAEFRRYGRQIFTPRLRNILLQFIAFISPAFVLKSLPIKRVPMDLQRFFINTIKNIIDYRTVNMVKRNDFIQLFLEMQEDAESSNAPGLTIEQIAAQAFAFFLAGFETSFTAMTFCLHELAFNQQIQNKLRTEIKEVLQKNNGELSYDAIMEMKYMEKVVNGASASISTSKNGSNDSTENNEHHKLELFGNDINRCPYDYDFETEAATISQEYSPYSKKLKNTQDWVNAIPTIQRAIKNDDINKIRIISDIKIQNATSTNNQSYKNLNINLGMKDINNISPDAERKLKKDLAMNDKENTSPNEERGSKDSIFTSITYDNVGNDNLDVFSTVDDSVADPDYAPSSDDDKSYIFSRQETIYYKEDRSDHDMCLKSSSEELNVLPSDNKPISYGSPEESTKVLDPKSKEEGVGRQNYKDRRDYCMYCEKDVSHFARHVSTWHSSEIDVARILSMKDSKRKRIEYSNLRKRGNFLRNRTNIQLRPVKRLRASQVTTTTAENFLPCKYCLGFYKCKTLYRHTKKCTQNVNTNLQRQTSQSDGQTTLLLGNIYKYDQLLKTELFPRMRADDISLIAKKDPLICHYAYSYIKGRRTKGNLDLVRQNVRRLAKLFKFVQKRDQDIKLFIDILRPCHFKMIVDGINEMAQYNHESEKYESPTLAMNFGTLLKKCCDLAIIEFLQKPNSREQQEDVNILKNLIVSQWADEVSAQAATNLNENKWNKEELLPLTADLKKLNEYLCNSAEQQYNKLKNNSNIDAYYALKDILYTQIILLNRRRPAEVAQLKIQTYQTINLDTTKQDTEFENCLTETEKILLNTYSRFIIRGKRGRGVPVLLSPIMRQHFDLLVTVRDKFVKNNNYIFHTKGRNFIDGTKIMRKYVERCGITRSKSITATLLRKHLATITQLLQFSNNDMEQLSKFMGHTLRTHCNVYRMSDNIYQTAKVSKLLLLMMEGGAENFKGKQLDEIDIHLTPLMDNQELFEQQIQSTANPMEKMGEENLKANNHSATDDKVANDRKAMERQPWTDQQKRIISKHFAENIKRKEAPKQWEVKQFVELYPELFRDRKWTSIKAVVYNIYTGKLKMK